MSKIKILRNSVAAMCMLFVTSVNVYADSAFDMLKSYYSVDSHLPLSLKVNKDLKTEESRVINFSFDGFDNEKITARLEISNIAEFVEKRPVVILLHGITQSLAQWWREDQGAYSFPSAHREQLVENGFAVLAIDLRNHGGRMQTHDFKDPRSYLDKGYFEAARKMISQSVLDVRRAVDVVTKFEDLDPNRIAVVGFSLGAWTGFLSTAIDDRIDAAVIIGMPFLPPAKSQETHFISQSTYVEGLKGKPMLLLAGTEDHFYTREMVDALQSEMSKKASVVWLESGHDFPRSSASITLQHLLAAF